MPSFISRWQSSAAAERANYQLFLSELADFLEVPRPDPTTGDLRHDAYVFERPVTFHHPNGTTSTGRIDLYKRGCFVLEAKQGSNKSDGSKRAFLKISPRNAAPPNEAPTAGTKPCSKPATKPSNTPKPSPSKTAGRPS
jgi:hypothetical protein